MPDLDSGCQKYFPISVVIPTLGGECLAATIGQLNRGTFIPSEILVCIPIKESSRVEIKSFNNVQIIETECRGQVGQRAVGFQRAGNALVLQLDDDILVRETCLQRMVESITEFKNVAVAPKFYNARTHKYHSFMVPTEMKQCLNKRLLFWIINGSGGYRPGQIGISGINMGVPEEPNDWNDLGWLPGGCILHRRENLILNDFYPFKGKAYSEDLFHSFLLKKRGVRLLRCGAAGCDVIFPSVKVTDIIGLFNFFKGYLAYARTMKSWAKMIDGSLTHLYLFLIFNLARLITSKIKRLEEKK